MSIAIECPQCTTFDVFVSNDAVHVKIPRILNDEQYLDTLDSLLKLRSEHAPMTWVFDLSELDDIPLALASVLLGFGVLSRDLAWEVRFTGIRSSLLPSMPRNTECTRCFGVIMSSHDYDCDLTFQSF